MLRIACEDIVLEETTCLQVYHSKSYSNLTMISLLGRAPVIQAVRFNCPWHRNSFRPCVFPFKMHEKLKNDTVDARTKTVGGKLMLMRRVLREQKFIGYVTSPRATNTQ